MNAPLAASSLSPIYALSLLGLAAYWLFQVARLARGRSWPRLGFLMPLGLSALLGAPSSMLDVPALFGMGLGFSLIAAYFPLSALHRPPSRRHWLGALALLAAGLLCLSAAALEKNLYLVLGGVAALLEGLGVLIWVWRYPKGSASAPQPRPRPQATRWQTALRPDPPDLALSLDTQQARVLNTSPYLLEVLGWTPARHNAWLPLRQQNGEVLGKLPSGQTGYLLGWEPLAPENGGVRLWYTRDGGPEVYLLSADWNSEQGSSGRLPTSTQSERVLN